MRILTKHFQDLDALSSDFAEEFDDFSDDPAYIRHSFIYQASDDHLQNTVVGLWRQNAEILLDIALAILAAYVEIETFCTEVGIDTTRITAADIAFIRQALSVAAT